MAQTQTDTTPGRPNLTADIAPDLARMLLEQMAGLNNGINQLNNVINVGNLASKLAESGQNFDRAVNSMNDVGRYAQEAANAAKSTAAAVEEERKAINNLNVGTDQVLSKLNALVDGAQRIESAVGAIPKIDPNSTRKLSTREKIWAGGWSLVMVGVGVGGTLLVQRVRRGPRAAVPVTVVNPPGGGR